MILSDTTNAMNVNRNYVLFFPPQKKGAGTRAPVCRPFNFSTKCTVLMKFGMKIANGLIRGRFRRKCLF
jgi:hypothetical protein